MVERGLRAERNGSPLQRELWMLQDLNANKVLNKKLAYHVYLSTALLWHHIIRDITPFELSVYFLSVYLIARQSSKDGHLRLPVQFEGGDLSIELYLDLLKVHNPVAGYSMEDVIVNLNLHPVYKDQGEDAFYEKGNTWWRGWSTKAMDLDTKIYIVLSALFILCVRSERALQYFSDNPTVLLSTFEAWVCFYKDVCLHDTPMFGFKSNPNKKRNQHTTEQKTWSAGRVLDALLQPIWKDPEILRTLITTTQPEVFASTLEEIKFFGGNLVFTHTLEYLQLWDSGCATPIFNCQMNKATLAKYIKAGPNSQVFLQIANSQGQRCSGVKHTYSQLAEAVRAKLPRAIKYDSGAVSSFPHFYATDGMQNACKAVEILQTFLVGTWSGKQRGPEPPEPTDKVRKSFLKKKSARHQ